MSERHRLDLSTHSAAWNLPGDLPRTRATSEHRGKGVKFKEVQAAVTLPSQHPCERRVPGLAGALHPHAALISGGPERTCAAVRPSAVSPLPVTLPSAPPDPPLSRSSRTTLKPRTTPVLAGSSHSLVAHTRICWSGVLFCFATIKQDGFIIL